jgi:hypothetical protein
VSFGGILESLGGVVGVILGVVVDGFVVVGVLGPQPTTSKPETANSATSFLTMAPSFLVGPWREGIGSRPAHRRRLPTFDAPAIELFPRTRLLRNGGSSASSKSCRFSRLAPALWPA